MRASLPAFLKSAFFLFVGKPMAGVEAERRVSRSVSGPGHPQWSRNGETSHEPTGKLRPVWCDGLRSGGAALVRMTRVCAAWSETHLISSYTILELPWAEAERPAVWVRLRAQSVGRGARNYHRLAINRVFWGGGREEISCDQRKPAESGPGQGHN